MPPTPTFAGRTVPWYHLVATDREKAILWGEVSTQCGPVPTLSERSASRS